MSLELEVTPGISLTKVCPIAGPVYSKVPYANDKISQSCDFISIFYFPLFYAIT